MKAIRAVGLLLLAVPAPALANMTLFAAKGFSGARLDLVRAESSMRFSPRSAQMEGSGWELCPRPFFGGVCIRMDGSQRDLRLPRAFSGVVQSARPLPPPQAAPDAARERGARPLPERSPEADPAPKPEPSDPS